MDLHIGGCLVMKYQNPNIEKIPDLNEGFHEEIQITQNAPPM
jgi:hypothetical protein